jgi:hypothetical protein
VEKEAVVAHFKVLTRNLSGWVEEDYESFIDVCILLRM